MLIDLPAALMEEEMFLGIVKSNEMPALKSWVF